ncbi:MAG: hypothetical protein GC192_00550 [Bacteroidetes bacterium]|nr:hypothetical protein [Bacteroidota bacterium]
MNLQAYITSGILELYVHGLASPEEIREVEAMAEQHPEVRQEIIAIQQTLERYSDVHGVQPPDGLKDKIMQRLDAAPKGRSRSNGNSEPPTKTPTPTASRAPRSTGETSVASIATWVLGLALIGALVAIFLFWQQAERANAQLKAAQDQVEEQRKACDEEKAKANKVNEQFIAIRHWATKPVQMKGTELGGDAFAVVYWNNIKKKALLDVVNLPTPPTDKQFQLWAIVDGKPTDMGVFEVASAGSLQEVPFIDNPQAFAVTLEPKGGSKSPTLDQMYVVGNVAKG